MAYAYSADPDQTVPSGAVWSGSTLFAIPLSILRNKYTKTKSSPKMYGNNMNKMFEIYDIYCTSWSLNSSRVEMLCAELPVTIYSIALTLCRINRLHLHYI